MKEVLFTSSYKKDYKKYKTNKGVVEKLTVVIEKLINEEKIPSEFKPHSLSGDYIGHLECHIENDVLLIWIDKDVIKLVRLGSHSELFGKGKKR